METKTKMMIAGGVLALVVTIIVIVVVNNKEDEKPKGEKPKGEKAKGETPPPAKCQSGQYKDTKGVCTLKSKTGQGCGKDEQCISGYCGEGVCTLKSKTGQGCGKDGDDTSCETGVCGQYKNNEYKCCNNSSTLGTLSDWCTTLRNGDDCHKNGQCLSGYCDKGKCREKSKTGQSCGRDGDDSTCGKGVCGQYRNNEYKCCDKSSTLWTFSDWCVNLKKGDGCHKDGQCTSGKCNSHKCV